MGDASDSDKLWEVSRSWGSSLNRQFETLNPEAESRRQDKTHEGVDHCGGRRPTGAEVQVEGRKKSRQSLFATVVKIISSFSISAGEAAFSKLPKQTTTHACRQQCIHPSTHAPCAPIHPAVHHAYIHTCIHTYMHTCTLLHVPMRARTHTHARACMIMHADLHTGHA